MKPLAEDQKKVLRYLLKEAYSHGFDSCYPLTPIAKEMGFTTEQLFDSNTNTGILWELSSYGQGLIDVSDRYEGDLYAGVNYDMKELAEHWSDFKYRG